MNAHPGIIEVNCYERKVVYGKKYKMKQYFTEDDPDYGYYSDYERLEQTLKDIDNDYPNWKVVNVQYVKDRDCPYYIFILERETIRRKSKDWLIKKIGEIDKW